MDEDKEVHRQYRVSQIYLAYSPHYRNNIAQHTPWKFNLLKVSKQKMPLTCILGYSSTLSW